MIKLISLITLLALSNNIHCMLGLLGKEAAMPLFRRPQVAALALGAGWYLRQQTRTMTTSNDGPSDQRRDSRALSMARERALLAPPNYREDLNHALRVHGPDGLAMLITDNVGIRNSYELMLAEAIRARDFDSILKLRALKIQADALAAPHQALIEVIEAQDVQFLTFLLEKGIFLHIDIPFLGKHYIHRAVETQNAEIVALLLKYGSRPSPQDQNSETPLHYAARLGLPIIADILIKAGANTEALNKAGETPKMLAERHNPEIVELLDREMKMLGALDSSATGLRFGRLGSSVMPRRWYSTHRNSTNLLDASRMEFYLRRNPNTEAPIQPTGSVSKEQEDLQKERISQHILKNHGVRRAIIAIRRNNSDALAGLLAQGVSPNSVSTGGHSLLQIAARAGKAACVELLLAKGADVNGRDLRGWTALHYAEEHAHLDIVQLLLNHTDIQVDAQTNLGTTALHMAALRDPKTFHQMHFYGENYDVGEDARARIIKELISHGASTEIANKDGFTPTDFATLAANAH